MMNNPGNPLKLSAFVLFLILSTAFSVKAATIFVALNATGLNDGTSWANAYTELQPALLVATAGDDVWLAMGTYYPTSDTNRDSTFDFHDQIDVLGGFVGTETSTAQRDPNNRTILSGNIGDPNDDTDNSKHVSWMYDSWVQITLDGFVIQDGYSENSSGAAVYTHDGLLTFINCIFKDNYSAWGGAVCSTTSSMDFINCVFENNSGVYGGAYQCWGSTTDRFFNCDFINNTSQQTGGAITAQFQSDLTFENCRFFGNEARSGGAFYIEQQAKVTSVNNIMDGNRADSGAAVFVTGASIYWACNSIVVQNQATTTGGGIFVDSGTTTLFNSILRGNMVAMNSQNIAGDTAAFNFGNCLLEMMRPGPGNMVSDPLFIDPDGPDNIPGNIDDDFHFLPNAPGINSADSLDMVKDRFDRNNNGDTTEIFPYDLDLNTRIQGGNLDRGPFESNVPMTATDFVENGMLVGTLYPNPSRVSYLEIESQKGQPIEIYLLNTMGQQLELLQPETVLIGRNILRLEAPETAAGLYLLEIRTKDQTTIKKWRIGE